MFCWSSQRRYHMWTIHDNVTILITFKTSNVRAISCYVCLFLALDTVILIIGHHTDCRQWNNHGGQLLYSIKLFNFGYCITECLWSYLIDVSCQTIGILQIFDKYPDSSCMIHKVASLSFHLESVDVFCKGFLFSQLSFHEA